MAALPRLDRPLDALVLYRHADSRPMRPTMAAHLRFLERGTERHRILYYNLARSCPRYIRAHRYDVVLLHYSLLAARWTPAFERIRAELAWLPASGATVVALPQDEYDESALLDEWLVDAGTDLVLSIFAGAERDLLYPGATRTAAFEQVLTGYVDERDLVRVARRPPLPHAARPLDLAYRASHLPYRLGAHAQLKHQLAVAFADAAPRHALNADVTTRPDTTIFGDAWLDFLASSRGVLGCESGASAINPRGEERALEAALRAADPALTFADFAARMPAGWDGHAFGAISPRHLEAAVVRSCQVLVEGRYDGVLEPETHYLPLAADLANVDEACERLRDTALTERLAARAHADVVQSGRYTYAAFARRVEGLIAGLRPAGTSTRRPPARHAAHLAAATHDRVAVRGWRHVYTWSYRRVQRHAPGVLTVAARTHGRITRS